MKKKELTKEVLKQAYVNHVILCQSFKNFWRQLVDFTEEPTSKEMASVGNQINALHYSVLERLGEKHLNFGEAEVLAQTSRNFAHATLYDGTENES